VTEYDVIIVGTGAGGGTLARHLAPSGKRILLLERGDWLPREPENWLTESVFVDNRYASPDTWYDRDGRPFQPGVHYFVGGATKLYGAALYRLREEGFGELRHHDGVSPAWPIAYDELEPYYTQAEQLYQVHGARGEDPTEPPASAPYPHPAVSHEPRIQQLSVGLVVVMVVLCVLVVPAVAWGIAEAFPIDDDYVDGLVLATLGAGSAAALQLTKRADLPLAVSLVVVLQLANIVSVPIWAGQVVSGASLSAWDIVKDLLLLVLWSASSCAPVTASTRPGGRRG